MFRHEKRSSNHQRVILGRKASHPVQNCENEDREFTIDSGASLRMMSKDVLALGEEATSRKFGDLPVIMTADGMAGSTEEATVYVSDLDVFAAVMLLEDLPAVLSLVPEHQETGREKFLNPMSQATRIQVRRLVTDCISQVFRPQEPSRTRFQSGSNISVNA